MVITKTLAERRRLPLLSAMGRDLAQEGRLRTSTAAAMWTGYAAHTVVTAWALRRRSLPLPFPARSSQVAGAVVAVAGAGLCMSAMSMFTSPRELTGTRNQAFTTTGVYRYSRNPQYLGYLLVLTGAALARRSGSAHASAGALAAAYVAWVPVEETHLTRLHGDAHADYTRQTHRWLGRAQR